MLAHQIAETLGIKLSSGVTRGDVVVGAISLQSQTINFDTYGDTINTAARIARNNKSGCYIALRDFVGGFFSQDDMYQDENNLDVYQGLFAKPIDFSQAKKIILKLPPQY